MIGAQFASAVGARDVARMVAVVTLFGIVAFAAGFALAMVVLR